MKNKKIKKDNTINNYHKTMLSHFLNMYTMVAQSFDKAILAFSTASLGFLAAFLRLIKYDHKIHIWLLKSSLVGFILAITFVILALILAEKYALHREIYHTYKLLKIKKNIRKDRCRDKFIGIFQIVSAVFFIIALSSFAGFVWLNV
jgi:hypothetical protein